MDYFDLMLIPMFHFCFLIMTAAALATQMHLLMCIHFVNGSTKTRFNLSIIRYPGNSIYAFYREVDSEFGFGMFGIGEFGFGVHSVNVFFYLDVASNLHMPNPKLCGQLL